MKKGRKLAAIFTLTTMLLQVLPLATYAGSLELNKDYCLNGTLNFLWQDQSLPLKGIKTAKIADTYIETFWKGVKGADEYEIYLGDELYASGQQLNCCRATIGNLSSGTPYNVILKAYTLDGGQKTLLSSQQKQITTTAIPPSTPGKIRASAYTTEESGEQLIRLSIPVSKDNENNITYEIYRNNDLIATVGKSNPLARMVRFTDGIQTGTIKGLFGLIERPILQGLPSGTYNYSVRAIDNGGLASNYSNITVTIPDQPVYQADRTHTLLGNSLYKAESWANSLLQRAKDLINTHTK